MNFEEYIKFLEEVFELFPPRPKREILTKNIKL
jgi:hypothetical protein